MERLWRWQAAVIDRQMNAWLETDRVFSIQAFSGAVEAIQAASKLGA